MNEIKTEILIDAPAPAVWSILTDFAAYRTWNPFIVKISGKLQLGAPILFIARMNGMRIPIVARILNCDRNKRLSWGGPVNRWAKFVVAADHYFIIENISATQCRFINGEKMSGLGPRLMWPMIRRSTPAYEAMNQALKERAERAHQKLRRPTT